MPNSNLPTPPRPAPVEPATAMPLHGIREVAAHPIVRPPVLSIAAEAPMTLAQRYPHYHKDVSHLDSIDVYRVLDLFEVTDQAIGHAIKKLLVAGGRGAGKNIDQDIKEAVDTLTRRQGMQVENQYRNQK